MATPAWQPPRGDYSPPRWWVISARTVMMMRPWHLPPPRCAHSLPVTWHPSPWLTLQWFLHAVWTGHTYHRPLFVSVLEPISVTRHTNPITAWRIKKHTSSDMNIRNSIDDVQFQSRTIRTDPAGEERREKEMTIGYHARVFSMHSDLAIPQAASWLVTAQLIAVNLHTPASGQYKLMVLQVLHSHIIETPQSVLTDFT